MMCVLVIYSHTEITKVNFDYCNLADYCKLGLISTYMPITQNSKVFMKHVLEALQSFLTFGAYINVSKSVLLRVCLLIQVYSKYLLLLQLLLFLLLLLLLLMLLATCHYVTLSDADVGYYVTGTIGLAYLGDPSKYYTDTSPAIYTNE